MFRNTIQQDIICNTVKGMRTHPSPDEVYERVRESYPSIGRATVYRVLNKLSSYDTAALDGFELTSVNLSFEGICKKCREQK